MQAEKISLFYKDAKSNKEYHAQLEQKEPGWVVLFQYGPRGGTLTSPPRQNSCRLYSTKNPGAAMKDESGSIRTSIQGPSGSKVAAAGEFGAGGGGARSWHWSGNTGALARGCAVHARPRAGMDCARPA